MLVTHDVAEAAFLSDVLVVMRAGRIVQRGPFATLVEAPADDFVASFLKSGGERA